MSSRSTTRITILRRVSLIGRERNERQGARPLDGAHDLALVLGAGPRDAPREDLRALRDEPLQEPHVLVVDEVQLLFAELAEFLLAEEELPLERLPAAVAAAPPAPISPWHRRLLPFL